MRLLLNRGYYSTFILNLGLMMDCLSELSIVSQPLQNDQITLSYAYQVLTRSVRIFQKMKESGSAQYVMESQEGVASRRYRGVCVDITSDEKRISSRKHSAIRGRRKRESWQRGSGQRGSSEAWAAITYLRVGITRRRGNNSMHLERTSIPVTADNYCKCVTHARLITYK